jgi:FKBP-type peptidyl-prolyl cis-trans isomerase
MNVNVDEGEQISVNSDASMENSTPATAPATISNNNGTAAILENTAMIATTDVATTTENDQNIHHMHDVNNSSNANAAILSSSKLRRREYPGIICNACRLNSAALTRSVRKSTILARCSACRAVYYCSKQCQKTDWVRHKSLCRHVRKMEESGEIYVKFIARAGPHQSRRPVPGNSVSVYYTARLANGIVFDKSQPSSYTYSSYHATTGHNSTVQPTNPNNSMPANATSTTNTSTNPAVTISPANSGSPVFANESLTHPPPQPFTFVLRRLNDRTIHPPSNAPLTAESFSPTMIAGWAAAIPNMALGERATIIIAANAAYGDNGMFAFHDFD